ncbi:MAG: alpha/beta hydrolase-fold protein, partial [Bacteroidales bacterium]
MSNCKSHITRFVLCLLILAMGVPAHAAAPKSGVRVRISFPASAHGEPITGRVYVAIARETTASTPVSPAPPPPPPNAAAPAAQARPRGSGGPIQQAGPTGAPLFGVNVENLRPGAAAQIDGTVLGHPVASLNDIPAGDYWVQAFVNVYTKFARADGHTVWLHMDQWEGQNWRRSPGNMFSTPKKVRIDPRAGTLIELLCDQVIPPIPAQADTDYVKHIKFESAILSKWWGHPIYLGATVLLPKDYDKHPDAKFPVNYSQGHFSTRAPGGFGSGSPFEKLWLADDMPRFLYVTFQHPSPYYDDSYAVNSENNGPYGDAIMEELVAAVEQKFRVIREPWARLLSGGSTGGWEALALQIFHPDFFGGTWASCPDSVDFRYHQIVNI